MTINRQWLLALLVGMITLSSTQANEIDPAQLEKAVHETLKNHPELLDRAASPQARRNKKRQYKEISPYQKMNALALKHHDAVYAHEGYPRIGNPKASHHAVVFSDPFCGNCHALLQDVVTYTKKHNDVVFTIKYVPFLGSLSEKLSEQALRATSQGNFSLWLEAYLKTSGPVNEKTLEMLSKSANTEPSNEDVTTLIQAAKEIAKILTIKSVPTFVIDDRVYEEYRGLESLSRLIDRRLRGANFKNQKDEVSSKKQ